MTAEGLTSAEAGQRRARGLGNDVDLATSRTYGQILRENVFTFINNVLFVLGGALVAFGRIADAVVAVGVILINVVVSVVQEIRAKRTLDNIALLTRPTATVVRDGAEVTLDPREVVAGDLLVAAAGDQIVVDGEVVDGRMDVDESLLTGESDLIAKGPGAEVYSGSHCATGRAHYRAVRVGQDSMANRLTAGARAFRRVLTPLQHDVNLMIRIVLLLVVYAGIVLALSAFADGIPLVDALQDAVVVVGLVPNGLFLAIALAYAMGAVRIAGRGALVQQANAVDSLANVDMLCLDKTGTLTTGNVRFYGLRALAVDETVLRTALGDFIASKADRNKTDAALAAACPGTAGRVSDAVPFSSAWKWSAQVIETPDHAGLYVLGAPEILRAALAPGHDTSADDWTRAGLRVLLFARTEPQRLHDDDGRPRLPAGLEPLGLIALADDLRPEAEATLAAFRKAGVTVKVISGDNPDTVAALARRAGLADNPVTLSGPDLAAMTETEADHAIAATSVFGRITPQQKEHIAARLKARGHHVAMIGDGVNDVLALKQASLGIAMQSGSQAARAVADIVLLNDSFGVLPGAVGEGQRIINGMTEILKLFMTRVFTVMLLIAGVGIIGGFPFAPTQNGLLAFLAAGVPSVALAAWARPGRVRRTRTIHHMLHFVLPASLTLGVLGLLVFTFYTLPIHRVAFDDLIAMGLPVFESRSADIQNTARTALTTFMVLASLLLVVFVEPPSRFWSGGNSAGGDWRPAGLALALGAAYGMILAWPPLREFFGLVALRAWDYVGLVALAAAWGWAIRWIWRFRLLDRFLDTDLGYDPGQQR